MKTEMNEIQTHRSPNGNNDTSRDSGWQRYAMWICCAAMLLPLGVYLLAGETVRGTLQTLGLLVPLAICLGVHALMHRLTGHSCHGAHGSKQQSNKQDRSLRFDGRKDQFRNGSLA